MKLSSATGWKDRMELGHLKHHLQQRLVLHPQTVEQTFPQFQQLFRRECICNQTV